MTERTTVRLPGDLLNRARRKAAAEGCTLTALIEEGLRLVLAEKQKPGRSKRILPPVSTATGGLLSSDPSALQELDDMEDVQRMTRFKLF
jgi:hypothetical protein